MVYGLLLSKDHRVFGGVLHSANSLYELKEKFAARNLSVSSPVGTQPPFFTLFLKGDVPGETESSDFRNPEWIPISKVFETHPDIWDLYCDLLLGGYRPPTKHLDIFYFGSGSFMASQLSHLVVKGKKRLTAAWHAATLKAGATIPHVGLISIVTDAFGIPLCCIETESVKFLPFHAVTEEMAVLEGEGDLSLEDWKRSHWNYFATINGPSVGLTFSEDEEIIIEQFRVLEVFSSRGRQDRPTVTFVMGLTGAGKSTLTHKLSRERKVHSFSVDEWMKILFWKDAPKENTLEWLLERISRSQEVILGLLNEELRFGRGAILDMGFSKIKDRAEWKSKCEALGAKVEFLFIDVPQAERWKRVEARNQILATSSVDTKSIPVDRATFDWMENFFEPLTDEERKHTTIL